MGRNKMNNKKTLTSLAAASMVITQAGQMSVFAKGAAKKEETKVEKTQKELLEEKIKEAQEKLDATKKEAREFDTPFHN